jgi:hypothetical protein
MIMFMYSAREDSANVTPEYRRESGDDLGLALGDVERMAVVFAMPERDMTTEQRKTAARMYQYAEPPPVRERCRSD